MGMPGMVTSIVESLKYLTPMAFDVMTFAVLKQLASPKKKLKVGRGRGAAAACETDSDAHVLAAALQEIPGQPVCGAACALHLCDVHPALLPTPSAPLQDDGVNLEEWYQWLAAFTGLLCKKHGCGSGAAEHWYRLACLVQRALAELPLH